MAKRSVYVDHLRGNSLFAELTRKELERVASAGTEIDLRAGTTVMAEGQPGRSAMVVLSGSMVVRRNGRKLRDVQEGEIIGEMSLLDDLPRSATVECSTDCSVLEIIGGQFRAVVDDVPAIRNKLLATLATRVRDLDRRNLG